MTYMRENSHVDHPKEQLQTNELTRLRKSKQGQHEQNQNNITIIVNCAFCDKMHWPVDSMMLYSHPCPYILISVQTNVVPIYVPFLQCIV